MVQIARTVKLLVVSVLTMGILAVAASPASAGRVLVTGHDADFHCAAENRQCGLFEVATNYVRDGAPDPSKPVLVLDRRGLDVEVSLDRVFGDGVVPRTVIDPRSPEFAAEPLTVDRYSAIIIASDITCGGCDLNESDSTPDSDAINARTADIERFFNDGGGLYFNSGARHGDGDPTTGPSVYYDSIPIGVQGAEVRPPFCLTPVGIELGLEDQSCPDPDRHNGTRDDINCCPTHNSFGEPPPGSALRVAERDADDQPQTMIAEGVIRDGEIVDPPPPDEACPPSNRFHLGKLFRDRQEGTGKIAAHVPGAGTLVLHRVRSDGKLRQDRLEVDEGGRYFLDVIPRGRTARKLEGASPGGPPVREQVRIGVTFNPNGGVPALDRARLYLIQRHGAPPPEPLPPTGGGDAPPSPFVGSDGCPIFPFIGLAKLRQSPDTGRPNQVVIVRGLDEIDEDAHLILTRNKRVRAARVELEGDGKTTIPVRLHGEALRELNRGFRAGERSRVEARLSIELFVGGLRETVRKRHVGVVRDGR